MPIANQDAFVQAVISAQRWLYAYIFRLLPRSADADDVLQETNIVLLQKRDEFLENTNFTAWATTIAHYQVLSFRLKRQRDRLCFDYDLLNELALGRMDPEETVSSAVAALDKCQKKLTGSDQSLLAKRYSDGQSVGRIASELNRTRPAISQSLYRIRTLLVDCVRKTIANLEAE